MSGVELLPVERQPHKPYPCCDARSMPVSRWWERHPQFPWCEARAPWRWGEQHLCDEHAAQLALGIAVRGINSDGRWKS